ncbi:MAG: hypothetical protein ACREN5_16920 [Gemmatimonadales bacterium]
MSATPSLALKHAEVARLQARLADLDQFEREWDRYAEHLRSIVQTLSTKAMENDDQEFRARCLEAERQRGKLHSLGPTKFDPNDFWTVPFQKLVGANLLTERRNLYETVGEMEMTFDGPEAHLSLDLLDVRLGEARALIDRKRVGVRMDLRATQQIVAELEREQGAQKVEVTLKALLAKWIAQVPFKPVRRFLGSAVIDHTKKLIATMIFAVFVLVALHFFPDAVHKVMSLWGRMAETTRASP